MISLRIAALLVVAAIPGDAVAQGVDPADGVTSYYLGQGVIGVTCLILLFTVGYLWRTREADRVAADARLDAVRKEHTAQIAAKDALINDLQQQRLNEALAGRDLTRTYQATMDAFLTAIRSRKDVAG